MGVDYNTCEVCDECRNNENLINGIEDIIFNSIEISKFMNKKEKKIFSSIKYCNHLVCGDDRNCFPLCDQSGSDNTEEQIKYFIELIKQHRKKKMTIEDIQNMLKCKKCLEEEREEREEKEEKEKKEEIKILLKEILNSLENVIKRLD